MTDKTKVTANFTPKALAAMDHRAQADGHTRTEVINRGIQVYDFLMTKVDEVEGSHLAIVRPDGTVLSVMIV